MTISPGCHDPWGGLTDETTGWVQAVLSKVAAVGPQENPAGPEAPVLEGAPLGSSW